jgi:hypothetical protein
MEFGAPRFAGRHFHDRLLGAKPSGKLTQGVLIGGSRNAEGESLAEILGEPGCASDRGLTADSRIIPERVERGAQFVMRSAAHSDREATLPAPVGIPLFNRRRKSRPSAQIEAPDAGERFLEFRREALVNIVENSRRRRCGGFVRAARCR